MTLYSIFLLCRVVLARCGRCRVPAPHRVFLRQTGMAHNATPAASPRAAIKSFVVMKVSPTKHQERRPRSTSGPIIVRLEAVFLHVFCNLLPQPFQLTSFAASGFFRPSDAPLFIHEKEFSMRPAKTLRPVRGRCRPTDREERAPTRSSQQRSKASVRYSRSPSTRGRSRRKPREVLVPNGSSLAALDRPWFLGAFDKCLTRACDQPVAHEQASSKQEDRAGRENLRNNANQRTESPAPLQRRPRVVRPRRRL